MHAFLFEVCEDKRNDCFYYDNAKCIGIYAAWAKQHCPHRCGYCQDKPKCIDTMKDCDKLDIRDCGKPEYAGYLRTNCRKTCNLCALPDIYSTQVDGSNVVTPSELPINNQTPARYENECVDHLGDQCLNYNDDKCYGIYKSWAKAQCAVRCGFCEGLEPPCIDRISYCDAYSQNTCSDPAYSSWARSTCRKFCGRCHLPTQYPVDIITQTPLTPPLPSLILTTSTTLPTTQTTLPVIHPGVHCLDAIGNCIDYVDESCVGIFKYWAMVNCPRRCGYCTDSHACMDYIKGCSHLPNVCNTTQYSDFAKTNCRRYCNYCNDTNNKTVSPSVASNHRPPTMKTIEPRPIIKGHMGKMFWVAFPETYSYSSSVKLHLFVTTDANTIPFLHVNASGSTSSLLADIKHPSKTFSYLNVEKPNTVEEKGILVSSNASVALYASSSYGNSYSDISWVPHITTLGTTYIAVSYHPYTTSYHSFISVISTQPDTKVNILLNTTGTVTYNGNTYRNGETILLYLTEYLSFQVSSNRDITGSKISSNRPIAVMSGMSTFYVRHTGGSVSSGSIYLPPVNKWGTTFIVPLVESAKRYVLRIVPSATKTSITVTSESGTINTYNVSTTLELNYSASSIYVVECDKPCFVAQIPASETGYNVTSYFVTIPAVDQFSRDYNIMVGNFISYKRHYMSIMIRSDEVYGLLMNGTTIFSFDLDIRAINATDTMWSILSIQVPEGYHRISHISPYSVYGLISYGFGYSNSYGYVAGLNI